VVLVSKPTFPYNPDFIRRFEDLIFHPKEVTRIVCECAGGELDTRHKFKYIVESAKKGDKAHGDIKQRTSYIGALTKYGSEIGRYTGMETQDVNYTANQLNKSLMEMFGYRYAPSVVAESV
jgi:hypothetical protein